MSTKQRRPRSNPVVEIHTMKTQDTTPQIKTAAEMLLGNAQVSDATFAERPVGLTGKFASLCDGDCGDGVCGQCN